jgi:transposase
VARETLRYFECLWTFVEHEGVEPTNNTAERALRHPVIARKLSFGSQSERGLRFIERMISMRATLRQQGRSLLDFLVDRLSGRDVDLLPA